MIDRYQEPDPPPRGYYRCIQVDDDVPDGALVYLLDGNQPRVQFVYGGKTWTKDRETFLCRYAAAPDGLAEEQQALSVLLEDIRDVQVQAGRSTDDLALIQPHIENGSLALSTSGPRSPEALKQIIATARNQAEKFRLSVESKQRTLEAKLHNQELIMQAEMARLSEIVETLQEQVWTVNLYLGTDEEIRRLAGGDPASADTPIVLRQDVLYMDEECAVAAETGGISAVEVECFDAWLTEDPAHLDQVLPESKGMVALKSRRHNKRYENPWQQAAMDDAAKKTYFLLRNGNNLYRMWTNFDAGTTLTPKTSEFLSFFRDQRYNFKTNTTDEFPLTPGSAAFMAAEKKADARRRHYMRVALILQGLVDRTTIFRPLAWTVNVGGFADYEERRIVVISDADLVLSDGRERFKDWLTRINGEMSIGMRVVGDFPNFSHGLGQYALEHRQGNERLFPRTASYPDSDSLHTLDAKKDGGFVFRYEREGERWTSRGGYTDWERKASCLVYPSDGFVLNFDAATTEEMDYYLRCRLDRPDYTQLFPMLKRAIRLKHEEEALELPFRQLIAGELAKCYAIDYEAAAQSAADLARWWKLKNREHRALTSDDAAALADIIREYGLRQRESVRLERLEGDAAELVRAVRNHSPDVLLIAHKRGSEFVALIPEDDDRRLYVREETWTTRGCKAVKGWQLADKRHERWRVLYESNPWVGWRKGESIADHLSVPELESLLHVAWPWLLQKESLRWGAGEPDWIFVPLAATLDRAEKVLLWFQSQAARIPSGDRFLTERMSGPDLNWGEIVWRRGTDRQASLVHYVLKGRNDLGDHEDLPWDGQRVLWRDEAAISMLCDERDATADARKQAAALNSRAYGIKRRLNDEYARRQKDAAYARFLTTYGDPELWDGHAKTLKLPTGHGVKAVDAAIDLLVERDVSLEGLTVRDILARAQAVAPNLKVDGVSDEVLDLKVGASDAG
ncbi:MAG: hypothetical protein ACYDAG_05670 [Chloroflexota bacterium]